MSAGAIPSVAPSTASSCVPRGRGPEEGKKESGWGAKELSKEEKQEVTELKRRDAEVRAHEQAHAAAGGHLTKGGASFEYQTGPDGKRYAVGGEVSIDTSGVEGDPEATIRKMQMVRRAALAPAQPSGQDRSVAAQASQKEAQARRELAQQKTENGPGKADPAGAGEIGRSGAPSPSGYTRRGTAAPSVVSPSPTFDATF